MTFIHESHLLPGAIRYSETEELDAYRLKEWIGSIFVTKR